MASQQQRVSDLLYTNILDNFREVKLFILEYEDDFDTENPKGRKGK